MNDEILDQFKDLGFTGVVALFILAYYRGKTVPLSDYYSTFAPRFWTGFVDSCVLWPIGFLATISLLLDSSRYLAAMLVIVQSFAWLLYTVTMHAHYGQTVGKMITKVQVVDFHTEGKITFLQAWLREGIPMVLSLGLVGYQVFAILTWATEPSAIASGKALADSKPFWLLTALPGLWFVAEILTMLTNNKRRALHDFIAGTVVIRTNTENEPAQQSAPRVTPKAARP
jgi:uncharacterized RDD family membrane protein YckC